MKTHLWGVISPCLVTFVAVLRNSIYTTVARFVLLTAGCLVASTVNAAAIQRVNLDGSGLTTLVTEEPGFTGTLGIALDLDASQMYWTATGGIKRANLDGSGETFLVRGTRRSSGMALDLGASQMYWAEVGTSKIKRANLDGSDMTDLVTGLGSPRGIALDLGADQIYWADFVSGIWSATLAGSDVTQLVGSVASWWGIALDPGADQMYVTSPSSIWRANLDGSDLTQLLTGFDFARGIALDLGAGHMYWANQGEGKIQRANLDGSDVIDLVTGLSGSVGGTIPSLLDGPNGIALDLDAGHIYFTSGVTAIPIPASLWLFVPGLASVGVLGWRRKKVT